MGGNFNQHFSGRPPTPACRSRRW